MGTERDLHHAAQGRALRQPPTTVDHFETPCGSYAATKLARYLLRFTADPRYGDNLERVLYNTILAVKPPDSDGDYPYYSTYALTARRSSTKRSGHAAPALSSRPSRITR